MLSSQSQWNDIPKRLATICIGVPILWLLWLDDRLRVVFWVGTHIVVAYEWTLMSKTTWGFLLSSTIIAHCPNIDVLVVTLVLLSAGITVLSKNATTTLFAYLNGWVLISLPFRAWIAISAKDNGFGVVVTLLLTVWNCDTGALIVGRLTKGRLFGNWVKPLRRSLAVISPKKSIEGLFGGVLFGTCTYIAMPRLWTLLNYFDVPTGKVDVARKTDFPGDLLVGLVLSLAAILGDLWESKLKRTFDIKDTGKLLPGHGGVLDRFDSSLVAVVIYRFYADRSNNS